MDVFEADAQQREEELHKWWQDNWKGIVSGVILAIVIITAVFWYRDYARNQRYRNAAEFYSTVMSADKADPKSVEAIKSFIETHRRDVYSQLAALSLAKQFVGEKKFAEAAEILSGSIGAARDGILDDIIRLRVARISLELKKYDEAGAYLDAIGNADSFKFEIAAQRGDIAYAAGKTEEAFKLYSEALTLADPDEDVTLIKMKKDSLNFAPGVKANLDGTAPAGKAPAAGAPEADGVTGASPAAGADGAAGKDAKDAKDAAAPEQTEKSPATGK